MKKNLLLFALVSSTILTSCDNQSASQVVEEEVITTMEVTLTGGGETITLTSADLDGDGPDLPISNVSGNLRPNTTYSGSIVFKNETVSPAEIINNEILENDELHQIFFQTTGSVGTFSYNDFDSLGKPIGLQFTLQSAPAIGTGAVLITLRHAPNKNAEGVSSGNIANAGGSTDIFVSFPITIE